MEDGAVRPFCRAGCETAARERVGWSGRKCVCGGGVLGGEGDVRGGSASGLSWPREQGGNGESARVDRYLGGSHVRVLHREREWRNSSCNERGESLLVVRGEGGVGA